ncbi:o-succinylbenzoate--CoA ligase [Salarchaeum sp. JOR-1]|uniref:o-succinylbenzoate--CoA ligase n=1 Tax=Salarchaeum sp. JOR-1 TaxID=2599399 RepID=UPI0011983076|nr:o-succinylbenzoate--CoA ligase [Salarchaeum sp. JOR-1]QDX41238.1 o-succinylbenzoate--CoA ligase [Salarchaeum sp. JOR-1]
MRDWLAHRVRASPDALALVDADAGTEWTFRDLDDAVAETARRLAGLGVEPGDHVGVLMENRPAFVRLVFAVQRVGATLVPLNARLAPTELASQVETADVHVVVTEAESEGDAVEAAGAVPVASVDRSEHDAVDALDGRDAAVPETERSVADTLALMFTSGTTGDPKAVRLTHANFLAAASASAFRLGVLPTDRWLCPLSMYHMGGLSVVLRSVLYGTTAVVQRGFDAERALDALDACDCTGVSLVPTMLRRMLDAGEFPDPLRFVLVGGAPTPVELREQAVSRGVPVYPSYGMTEAASQIATGVPEETEAAPGSVGRPLMGYDVTVAGPEGELPAGEVGAVHVAGPSITPGYYDAPDANADAFTRYGFDTGDAGYVDASGRLHVLNRQSDRIITGGENVHPAEVLEVLRDHPAVAEAAVVGVDDPEWGERVAALVVADGETDADALQAFCRERLAGYKVPRTIAFADDLPRTASGTVDRAAVREALAAAADV